jgi:hypothetical protein
VKRSGFKMRSGNSPLAFKLMGGSPVKQEYQTDEVEKTNTFLPEVKVSDKKNIADRLGIKKVDRTKDPIYKPRNTKVVNKNEKVSSSDQVKKPGIDTQLVEYVRRKIDERKDKNENKKGQNFNSHVESMQSQRLDNQIISEDDWHKLSEREQNQKQAEPNVKPKEKEKKVKTKEELDNPEKKGWKFDIDWNEVGTNAVGAIVTTGIKAGVEALGRNKKPIRKGGSISGFASQKFSSGSNLFAKKSDDT